MLQTNRVRATSSGQLSLDALLKDSSRSLPDIGVIATRGSHSASILVWNYDDDAVAAPPAKIDVEVDGLPPHAGQVLTTQFRIDSEHSDSYTVWQAMGSPQHPTPAQVEKLKAAGQLQLVSSPEWLHVHAGTMRLSFALPRQGLSLFRLHWRTRPTRIATASRKSAAPA